MKELPNGVTVFNATPHTIRFWAEGWNEPVEVESDVVINATVHEKPVKKQDNITFVSTVFVGNATGKNIAIEALEAGANVVVGSIIAAQAYPGLVVGMTPAPGYERVPPAEKRMNPNKFTIFS